MSARAKAGILILDTVVLLIGIAAIFSLRFVISWHEAWVEIVLSQGIWLVVFTRAVLLYVFGAYDLEKVNRFQSIFWRVITSEALATILIVLINFFAAKGRSGIFGRGILISSIGVVTVVELCYRYLIWKSLQSLQEHLRWLLISSKGFLEPFFRDLSKNPFHGKVTVLTDAEGTHVARDLARKFNSSFEGQGSWAEVDRFLDRTWAFVVLAIEDEKDMKTLGGRLMQARFSGEKIEDLTSFYEQQWKKVPLYYLNHSWFVLSEGFNLIQNPVGLRLKRLIDLFLSTFLLLLTWPLMVLTGIAIRLDSKGEIFFRQVRTGRDGAEFKIYKFRSMRMDAEAGGAQWARQNDSRITRVGKFIRVTRIDELPQLLNVFRGEMSFIGPRPERPEFNSMLEKEIAFYQLRHLVNPGITGWAQVLYPYGASVEDAKEKLQYELFYIKNYSLWMDVQIVLKTIRVVLLGRGR